MVCLDTVISEIISDIEYENTIILTDITTQTKFAIDLDYLRHHSKLQNARIFRMILGFEQGLWKKPEYDKKKYSKIFNDYHFTKNKWTTLREFLNTNKVSGLTESIIYSKKNTLFNISCTFGGIPIIDEYLTEESEVKPIQYYNPLNPKADKELRYKWSIMNSNHNGFSSWTHNMAIVGWEVVNIEKVSNGSNYYARKLRDS